MHRSQKNLPAIMASRACANDLFVAFLHELKKEAQQNGSSRMIISSFSKAIVSMQKYPLPLTRGRDAIILEGIGEYIAKRLDEKLEAYLRLHSNGAQSHARHFLTAHQMTSCTNWL